MIPSQDVNFLKLVRAAILIDTANLSERTKKATPKDVKVLEVLETRLQGIEQSYMDVRVILFKRLLEAKRDVDHFTLPMLLKKDMKVANIHNGIFTTDLNTYHFADRWCIQGRNSPCPPFLV